MFRNARIGLAVVALVLIGVSTGSAAPPNQAPTKQDIAKKILASKAGQTLSAPARAYMESVARNDHRLAPDSNGISTKAAKLNAAKGQGGTPLVNVRVNNPANDTHQTDQTTQSETAIAVSGSNVAVGYNDSQNALAFLTAGADITGYAYSTDGGQTWTITYASNVPIFDPNGGCSFQQYIGAQPLVAGGVIYDASEFISVDDPDCTFTTPVNFSEAIFSSNDGGSTWTAGAVIPITSSVPQNLGAFQLGPAQFMRNLEFPTL